MKPCTDPRCGPALDTAKIRANAELLAEVDRLKGEWDALNGLRLDASADLDAARLDIALHAEAAHRFQADADEARTQRDDARGLAAALEAELARVRAFAGQAAPPRPTYRTGFCQVGNHRHCPGAVTGITCACSCHLPHCSCCGQLLPEPA